MLLINISFTLNRVSLAIHMEMVDDIIDALEYTTPLEPTKVYIQSRPFSGPSGTSLSHPLAMYLFHCKPSTRPPNLHSK